MSFEMDELKVVLRGYAKGETELEPAARRLLSLWQDPVSGGFGLYVDQEGLDAAALMRARALESRFHELVTQAIPKPRPGGSA